VTERLPVDIDQALSRTLLTGTEAADFAGAFPVLNDAQISVLETSRSVSCVSDAEHSGSIKRVATAVGEGAMVIRLIFDRVAHPTALSL
jgi:hypothetical protein